MGVLRKGKGEQNNKKTVRRMKDIDREKKKKKPAVFYPRRKEKKRNLEKTP